MAGHRRWDNAAGPAEREDQMNDFYRWPRLWVLSLTLLALIAGLVVLG